MKFSGKNWMLLANRQGRLSPKATKMTITSNPLPARCTRRRGTDDMVAQLTFLAKLMTEMATRADRAARPWWRRIAGWCGAAITTDERPGLIGLGGHHRS